MHFETIRLLSDGDIWRKIMRILKTAAVLMSVVMLTSAFTGCGKKKETKNKQSTKIEYPDWVGKNEIKGELEQEAVGNETGYILNSVIHIKPEDSSNGDYYYLDVTIKNQTDTAYALNALNNFYIELDDADKTRVEYFVGADAYGSSHFKDDIYSVVSEEYQLAANGEFSGIIGGFSIDPAKIGSKITVCFFPTRENADDKEDVIKVDVPADKIIEPTADMLK